MRHSGRENDEIRQIEIIPNFNPYAEGSCLIKCGNTHVVCTVSMEEKVPAWLRGQNRGWITAEYGMLPRATQVRVPRELKKPSGRTQEIQRLIGRSLRAVVDLTKMKDISLCVDALDGRPGVFTARYAPNRDFDKGMDKLLAELKDVLAKNSSRGRKAHFPRAAASA